MAWVDLMLRKRRLSGELRAGLRLRWELSHLPLGGVSLPQAGVSRGFSANQVARTEAVLPPQDRVMASGEPPDRADGTTDAHGGTQVDAEDKLRRLLSGF